MWRASGMHRSERGDEQAPRRLSGESPPASSRVSRSTLCRKIIRSGVPPRARHSRGVFLSSFHPSPSAIFMVTSACFSLPESKSFALSPRRQDISSGRSVAHSRAESASARVRSSRVEILDGSFLQPHILPSSTSLHPGVAFLSCRSLGTIRVVEVSLPLTPPPTPPHPVSLFTTLISSISLSITVLPNVSSFSSRQDDPGRPPALSAPSLSVRTRGPPASSSPHRPLALATLPPPGRSLPRSPHVRDSPIS